MAILSVITILLIINKPYDNWKIVNNNTNKKNIAWAKFKWVGEEMSGRNFDKSAMFIPCKMNGIPNVLTFQFDLGADLSGVYELNYSSFYKQNPDFKNSIKNVKFRNKEYFENISIHFDNYTATNVKSFVNSNYGEVIDNFKSTDTIHMGTIGADMFKDKVLIIDYPNKQFAITERIPYDFSNVSLVNIMLDKKNRPLLPMLLNGKSYKVLFDNGSSIFPLISSVEKINEFSKNKDIDTIKSLSWGVSHNLTGKLIDKPFILAGQKYTSTIIYADHRKQQTKGEWDLIAGNALFWDKIIIIDFKNRLFGVN